MTHLIRNRRPVGNKSRLMIGCGGTALALALTLAPQRAEAQAVNADGSVIFGGAAFDNSGPGQTAIDVITPTTVIDWQPFEDAGGNALTFLPAGNTMLFRSNQLPNFAVLNRLLPSTNGNIAVIDGSVISQLIGPSGAPSTGGFVAFYSPTGILVGNNATFDVGQLLLTTLDTTPASFANFANGGNLSLSGTNGSTARIQINPGAQINALAENSFFAVVAADVQMLGSARVNGSHAYIAGEVVNLSFSNGLFNISIPVGTAASGNVMTLDGNVGGPSSTGAGDNHMLYAVARASADPISMLFSGNLGFDPALSAGIVNGEIILAANYDVFGRFVDGGTISDGINAVFDGNSATSTTRADIEVRDFTSTSTLLAIGTHNTAARAVAGPVSVLGDLLLVGRENSTLSAQANQSVNISGDVLVSARDYGVVSSGLQDLSVINAQGGSARISLLPGGSMTIGGDVFVTADAFAGADDLSGIAGSARAGSSVIFSSGGTLNILGSARVSARAEGAPLSGVSVGAESRGGLAQLSAAEGGAITIGQDVVLDGSARGAIGDLFNPSTVSNAFGGNAQISTFAGGGSITVNGSAQLFAEGLGGSSNNAGAGSVGTAGRALLAINDVGDITILGSVDLIAGGVGGTNAGGTGGIGRGGRASAATFNGGTIIVGGQFNAIAPGVGGDGQIGGNGSGGIAGAIAEVGAIELRGLSSFAVAEGIGGSATFGFGGNGGIGRGGNSFFQANGTLTETATLTIAGDAFAFAEGVGGDGGFAGPSGSPAGQGGDGFGGDISTPNQADPDFGSGAFILTGGDNGNLSVAGDASAVASGRGGRGGFGDSMSLGGIGGNGFGGLAQVGLALFGLDGSVGQGSATFTTLQVEADGFGGNGGLQFGDFPTGAGGTGTGGAALLTARAGTVTVNQAGLNALGFGGDGQQGGIGTGGSALALGSLGGVLDAGQFRAVAVGFGGTSTSGPGGTGRGGTAGIALQGITVTVTGDTEIDASGFGGSAETGNGGDGFGGEAFVGVNQSIPGNGTFSGNTGILANGFGGAPSEGATGGTGRGGLAYAQAQGGSTVRFGTLQVTASGVGGQNEGNMPAAAGGDGFGGTAELRSLGSGSQLIVERNFTTEFFDPLTNRGAIVAAIGIGEETTGGSGIGGSGTGGSIALRANLGGSIALPADPQNDPGSVGFISLLARGFGGGSRVEGGAGGIGAGGNGTFEIDGGSISMGRTNFSVFGVGGNGLNPLANITGGDGFGGTRLISILNGGTLSAELFAGGSGATGGLGRGTGNGGNATGGSNRVEINNGTLNSVGRMFVADQAFGGNGNNGGNAVAGTVAFEAINATINFDPDAEGNFGLILGGQSVGGNGVVSGGDAIGETVSFVLQDSTVIGGNFLISPLTIGGNASGPGGIGGSATAISATFSATGSTIDLTGTNFVSADARGGNGGPQGTGGDALSGIVDVILQDSVLTLAAGQSGPGILRLQSIAQGGGGNASGTATSELVRLELIGSSLTADELYLDASAFANSGPGAAAQAGDAELRISGASQLTADLIEISADAVTGEEGFSQAGIASLAIAQGSSASVIAEELALFADASGAQNGRQANGAGQFIVNIAGGDISAQNLRASAGGDFLSTSLLPSALIANGGNINVAGELTADLFGNLLIQTGQGSIIGSAVNAASTTDIEIISQGRIDISGDNDAVVGLGGNSISFEAREIDINQGARIGAETVLIISLERNHTAIIGGSTDEIGFTLTADEIARIEASDFAFIGAGVITNDENQPAVLVRDMSISGSLGDGFSNFSIFGSVEGPSIVRVEGTVSFINAAIDDQFVIGAGTRIEVVTPGGIRIANPDGAPSGILTLSSRDIWVTDSETILQLQANRNFAGRDALLAVAAAGSNDPLGYIRAGGMTLNVGSSLLVRNTGAAFAGGGLLVGDGGLSITGTSQLSTGNPLDVFAYGRRQTAPGVFVTGEAFFDEVNLNRAGNSPTAYLAASAFNDCIINTGECPQAPPPPPPPSPEVEAPPEINNPVVFEPPLTTGSTPLAVDGEDDDRFGIDFPEQPEAPLISEDPLLDDPVSSGGDASLYSGSVTPPAGGK